MTKRETFQTVGTDKIKIVATEASATYFKDHFDELPLNITFRVQSSKLK